MSEEEKTRRHDSGWSIGPDVANLGTYGEVELYGEAKDMGNQSGSKRWTLYSSSLV